MSSTKTQSGSIVETDDILYDFVQNEILGGTDKNADEIFSILAELIETFGSNNAKLLEKREGVQGKIDQYYKIVSDSKGCADTKNGE